MEGKIPSQTQRNNSTGALIEQLKGLNDQMEYANHRLEAIESYSKSSKGSLAAIVWIIVISIVISLISIMSIGRL